MHDDLPTVQPAGTLMASLTQPMCGVMMRRVPYVPLSSLTSLHSLVAMWHSLPLRVDLLLTTLRIVQIFRLDQSLFLLSHFSLNFTHSFWALVEN